MDPHKVELNRRYSWRAKS